MHRLCKLFFFNYNMTLNYKKVEGKKLKLNSFGFNKKEPFFIILIIIISLIFWLISGIFSQNFDVLTSCSRVVPSRGTKSIFLFTPLYKEYMLWDIYFQRIILGSCTESRCRFVYNESDLPDADAVLFSASDLPQWPQLNQELISKRKLKQLWILFSMEPPSFLNEKNLENYSNFFNMTMSYDKRSDIVSPFGSVLSKKRLEDQNPYLIEVGDQLFDISSEDFLSRKKFSVIFLSSCEKKKKKKKKNGSSSKRDQMLQDLKVQISVDVFGECGTKKGNIADLKNSYFAKNDTSTQVISDYYFYLAFESSLCQYYNTEHFYRALYFGAVPVVLGPITKGANVPPNSYIDASKFQRVDELAEFLMQVSKHNSLYLKYHEWRQDYTVKLGYPYDPQPCDLCAKLHQRISTPKQANINQWLSKEKMWK